ncbi:hypothetical protein WN55_01674 [Dufourea novaeangliae]|uniref:Uncharacterized protein n=1 Tax=Dufourea novaeangliae TaxID=178035 RepID=A0A154PHK6_DUFNO|nr:hypothetical protein WN55_01674 [Dufourea novaeangliae]
MPAPPPPPPPQTYLPHAYLSVIAWPRPLNGETMQNINLRKFPWQSSNYAIASGVVADVKKEKKKRTSRQGEAERWTERCTRGGRLTISREITEPKRASRRPPSSFASAGRVRQKIGIAIKARSMTKRCLLSESCIGVTRSGRSSFFRNVEADAVGILSDDQPIHVAVQLKFESADLMAAEASHHVQRAEKGRDEGKGGRLRRLREMKWN